MNYRSFIESLSLAGILALSIPLSAEAQAPYDWMVSGVHVTRIEATYMPSAIPFAIDAPGGSCAAGTTLQWSGTGADAATQQANTKAVYAALLAAKLSGSTIRAYGVNSGCVVKFIYLE